jgi:hypothetical protein
MKGRVRLGNSRREMARKKREMEGSREAGGHGRKLMGDGHKAEYLRCEGNNSSPPMINPLPRLRQAAHQPANRLMSSYRNVKRKVLLMGKVSVLNPFSLFSLCCSCHL